MSNGKQQRPQLVVPSLSPKTIKTTKQKGEVTPLPSSSPLPPLELPPSREDLALSKAAILSSAVVQHVGRILANGTKYSGHQHINFQAHDGLLIKLRTAAEHADEDEFFSVLATYLTEAASHVPHAGRVEDVDEVMLHLKLLVHDHQHGFTNLSGHLLAVAYAPVDRF